MANNFTFAGFDTLLPQTQMARMRSQQQQAPEQSMRRSGLIASFLPTALSLAGGALGSVLAPGIGTAAGGAGGAVLGKKLQDMITGQQ